MQTRRASGRAVAPARRPGERDRERRERRRQWIRRARRAEREHHDRQRPTRTMHDDATLAVLLWLGCARRLAQLLRGLERRERRGGPIRERLGRVVAGHDDVRVVRRVEAAVVRVQTVAGHDLDLVLATDDALSVRVAAERDRLQLLTEQERRIVLETFALAHDHGALGFGLLGRDERIPHAVGLELERRRVPRLR